jgi:hypothetical protein
MGAQFSQADVDSEKSRILDALSKYSGAFAPASALGIKAPRAKAALGQLVEAGQLRRFGAPNRPVYRASESCSENEFIELAADQLRTLHKGGTPVLVPFARMDDVLRKLPTQVREYKFPALKRLAQRREVIIFQHGRLRFLVFTASLGQYLHPATEATQEVPAETTSNDDLQERIHKAYTDLRTARRSPDVPISELYAKVGGSLDAFHEALRTACFEHRAVPTSGEPAFASQTALDQALVIDGEKFLNFKFLP